MSTNEYTTVSTEVKVSEKTVLDKDGKETKEAVKESISFLVPKLAFFADAVNAEFRPAVVKTETSPAIEQGYNNLLADWLFDAVISKCRQTLTSRVTVKGAIEWKKPYKPWTSFAEMVKILGQRGRAGKDTVRKEFVASFTSWILTLNKSDKFVTQRIALISDNSYLASHSEEIRAKIADNLASYWTSAAEAEKVKFESVFGDLVAVCSGVEAIDELSDE